MAADGGRELPAQVRSSDPDGRVLAARELGRCRGDRKALGMLWYLLRDEEKRVRAAATDAIAEHGEEAIPMLQKGLEDPDWIVRYRSVEALGKIGGERARGLIARMLRDERDHVRYMAAKSLEGQVPEEALRLLQDCLQDSNPYVRRAAAVALASSGMPDAKKALMERLEAEDSDEIRRLIQAYLKRERVH